jgi:hypothetical protein
VNMEGGVKSSYMVQYYTLVHPKTFRRDLFVLTHMMTREINGHADTYRIFLEEVKTNMIEIA